MEDNRSKTITLYSYTKVWIFDKKIYAIQNFKLPVPIDPWQIAYFGLTWLICTIVFGAIPGFTKIPVALRSILMPYAISKFMMTKKLDGKNPMRFFLGILVFLFTEQGKCVERFTSVPEKKKIVKLDWYCSKGVTREEDSNVSLSN